MQTVLGNGVKGSWQASREPEIPPWGCSKDINREPGENQKGAEIRKGETSSASTRDTSGTERSTPATWLPSGLKKSLGKDQKRAQKTCKKNYWRSGESALH